MCRFTAMIGAVLLATCGAVLPATCGAVLLAGCSAVLPATCSADDARPFVVVLYPEANNGSPGNVAADRGIRQALGKAIGSRVEIHNEYLEISRFPDEGYQADLAQFLRRKYAGRRVDLVVAGLASGLDYAVRYRDQIFPGAPIVLCAVDASEVASRDLPPSVVGKPIQMDVVDSLDAGLRLFPSTRHVYVIAGKAKFDQYWEREARRELSEIGERVELVFLTGLTMADLQDRVASLPKDSLIYYLHVFEDGTGKVYMPAEALSMITAEANAPVFSHVDSYLGRGIIGGRVFSFERAGQSAGELAARILQGERPEMIGVSAPLENAYVFDWREMQRWKLRESALPQGSEVRFKQPTIWEAYRWQMTVVLSAVLLQGVLILGLIFERFQRARAEAARRQAEGEVLSSQAALRELTGKLLGAQEDERGRIARELHDDLGQGLALLAVELDMLKQARSEDVSSLLMKVEKLSARVKNLSSSVHDLSHQLHPMKLEQLGLAAAIGGLCKEVSEAHDMPIRFEHEPIPKDVSAATALCLYRITQEGLQNVIKHSAAHEAAVSLKSVDSSLVLSLQDDGHGLDRAGLATTQGIGLAGMRERVRLIHGSIDIDSSDRGAQITVRVPV